MRMEMVNPSSSAFSHHAEVTGAERVRHDCGRAGAPEHAHTHDRIVVTRNGRPAAVMISPDDLASLEDTLELLSDPDAMRELTEAKRAADTGDYITGDELRARFASAHRHCPANRSRLARLQISLIATRVAHHRHWRKPLVPATSCASNVSQNVRRELSSHAGCRARPQPGRRSSTRH
jgi:PHD/YefM family antitoxin component YafN of YafNO toxin-antitoxin module